MLAFLLNDDPPREDPRRDSKAAAEEAAWKEREVAAQDKVTAAADVKLADAITSRLTISLSLHFSVPSVSSVPPCWV